MIRCRILFGYLLSFAVFAWCAANEDVLPPTRSATHMLTTSVAPVSETESPPRDAYRGGTERDNQSALVFETSDGSRVTSSDVNRITCRARRKDDAGRETGVEWLGTQFGVKAIDSVGGRVVHYTQIDGLPGDYIEAIVAAPTRVYCLVRLNGPEKLALCAIELGSPSARWTTLATVDAPVRAPRKTYPDRDERNALDDSWCPRWGLSHLALTPNGDVVVAPSAVDRRSDNLIYRWDSRAHVLSPVSWDALLRVDSDVIGINDVYVDADQTVHLATTSGLLSLSLVAPKLVWRRTLPDKRIDALLIAPAGKAESAEGESGPAIYLAYHERKSGRSKGGDKEGDLNWYPYYQMMLFHTRSGTAQQMPRRHEERYDPGGFALSGFDDDAIDMVESISWADDGAIWLTSRGISRYGFGYPVGIPAYSTGFSRFDIKARQWTQFSLDGLTSVEAEDFHRKNPYKELPLAAPGVVPDAAVYPFAFERRVGAEVYERGEGGVNRSAREWIAARFPSWWCETDEAARGERQHHAAIARDDPTNGGRWRADGQDLIFEPKVPKVAPRSSDAANAADATLPVHFTLHSGTHFLPASVREIAPLSVADDAVLLRLTSGIYRLADRPKADGGAPVWKRLNGSRDTTGRTHADEFRPFGLQDGQLGSGGYYCETTPTQHLITRFVPDGSVASVTSLDIPKGARVVAFDAAGAWLEEQSQFRYVPLRSNGQGGFLVGKAESIADLPERFGFPKHSAALGSIGITGSIVWYKAKLRLHPADTFDSYQSNAVIGYDADRKRWTNPLPIYHNLPKIHAAADGSVYVFDDQTTGSVFRYVAATGSWKAIAVPRDDLEKDVPPGRNEAEGPAFVAADERDIFALDGSELLRYDRQRRIWSGTRLPRSLWGSEDLSVNQTWTATKNALWFGTLSGLWRFDRARQTWKQIDYPISLEPQPPVAHSPHPVTLLSVSRDEDAIEKPSTAIPDNALLTVDAVDRESVWGSVSPWGGDAPLVYRFDKATRHFTVYDPSAGLPTSGEFSDLAILSDGDSVWVTRGENTYYLNRRSGRFEKRFHDQALYSQFRAPEPTRSVFTGTIGAISPDPTAPDVAYLLLASLRNTDNESRPLLFRFQKRTGVLEPLPMNRSIAAAAFAAHPLRDRSSFGEPLITGAGGLYLDADHIWVGTSIGLFWVDRRTGEWSPAKLPTGMPRYTDIEADDIHADEQGSLWVSDSRSIMRIAR